MVIRAHRRVEWADRDGIDPRAWSGGGGAALATIPVAVRWWATAQGRARSQVVGLVWWESRLASSRDTTGLRWVVRPGRA